MLLKRARDAASDHLVAHAESRGEKVDTKSPGHKRAANRLVAGRLRNIDDMPTSVPSRVKSGPPAKLWLAMDRPQRTVDQLTNVLNTSPGTFRSAKFGRNSPYPYESASVRVVHGPHEHGRPGETSETDRDIDSVKRNVTRLRLGHIDRHDRFHTHDGNRAHSLRLKLRRESSRTYKPKPHAEPDPE
jgi:hypothetical protein